MKKSTTNLIIGFLTGVTAGAVIGILYAPDEGVKTRKKIKENSEKLTSDVTESLKKQLDHVKKYVNDFVTDVKGRFDKVESEIKGKAAEKQGEMVDTAGERVKQANKTA